MELCILFEDGEVWIKMSADELAENLTKKLGKDVQPAMDEVVAELKQRTLTQ